MTPSGPTGPEFEHPPVVEVVLSVQFEPLAGLRAAQMGLLWAEFRDRYPNFDEQPPLEPVVEAFGTKRPLGARVSIEVLDSPPVPRYWFLDEDGTHLIQVQQDRFIINWRKSVESPEYPRYQRLRAIFSEHLATFRSFVEREGLGPVVPNQCEVTYVDEIAAGEVWQHHGQIGRVFTLVRSDAAQGLLPEPQDVMAVARYIINGDDSIPFGRLHVTIQPAFRKQGDVPIFLLNMTARGKPVGEDMEGVFRFLDVGQEWIVRGFVELTTAEMQRAWGRIDGG